MTTVSDREDRIIIYKDEYSEKLREFLTLLKDNRDKDEIQAKVNELHDNAVKYFNEFERTCDEYNSHDYNLSEDTIVRKAEDALNIWEVICFHWRVLFEVQKKIYIFIPNPQETAYASIQRIIKKRFPERVEDYKNQFKCLNLPVYGFENKSKHTVWKMKKPIWLIVAIIITIIGFIIAILTLNLTDYQKLELYIGIASMILSGLILFSKSKINATQFLFVKGLLAIGLSSLLVASTQAFIEVKWNLTTDLLITASGGIAIFLLLYKFSPDPPKPLP